MPIKCFSSIPGPGTSYSCHPSPPSISQEKMQVARKLLIIQATDHFNLNILQFLHEKLILLLQFITGIFTYLPEKFLHFLHEKLILLLQFITDILTYLPEKFLHFLHEKLILFIHFITGIFTYLPEKFPHFLHEKLILLLHFITDIFTYLPEKFLHFLHEKLILFIHSITGIFTYLCEKFDEIFPPETRSETVQHWLHILLTVVIPACLAIFVFCLCFPLLSQIVLCCYRLICRFCVTAFTVIRGSCSQVLHAVSQCFRFCFPHIGYVGTMMKAPGQAGVSILRESFEASPKLYFSALRAG